MLHPDGGVASEARLNLGYPSGLQPSDCPEATSALVRIHPLPATSSQIAPIKQSRRSIDSIVTNVIIQEFTDRTLVVITQNGKLGLLIQAALPAASSPYAPLKSPLENDDFDYDYDDDLQGQTEKPRESVKGASSWIPAPSPNLVQTSLLGALPSGFASLFSLYVSSVFSLLRPGPSDPLDPDAPQQNDQRPVVVALSLQAYSIDKQKGVAQISDEFDEDIEKVANSEGPRFREVMTLVQDCLQQ